MGYVLTTEGVYRGALQGTKKDGDVWTMYKFSIPEIHRTGCILSPSMMTKANINAFPVDNLDCPLQIGETARLDLDVAANLSNGKAYPEFKLIKIHKKS